MYHFLCILIIEIFLYKSVSVICIIYIALFGWIDFVDYYFQLFKSQLFFRDEPFIKNVSFIKNNVLYSKLLSNPFKHVNTIGEVDIVQKKFMEDFLAEVSPMEIGQTYSRIRHQMCSFMYARCV